MTFLSCKCTYMTVTPLSLQCWHLEILAAKLEARRQFTRKDSESLLIILRFTSNEKINFLILIVTVPLVLNQMEVAGGGGLGRCFPRTAVPCPKVRRSAKQEHNQLYYCIQNELQQNKSFLFFSSRSRSRFVLYTSSSGYLWNKLPIQYNVQIGYLSSFNWMKMTSIWRQNEVMSLTNNFLFIY